MDLYHWPFQARISKFVLIWVSEHQSSCFWSVQLSCSLTQFCFCSCLTQRKLFYRSLFFTDEPQNCIHFLNFWRNKIHPFKTKQPSLTGVKYEHFKNSLIHLWRRDKQDFFLEKVSQSSVEFRSSWLITFISFSLISIDSTKILILPKVSI